MKENISFKSNAPSYHPWQGHLEIFVIVEHPLVEPVGGDCVDVDGGAAGPPPVGDVVDGGGTHLLR